jgi:hypothetical protein
MADKISLDKDSIDALAKALRGGTSSYNIPKSAPIEASAEGLKKAFTVGADAVEAFAKSANNSMDVWRDLSKTGSSFSNDLIGMTAAAANSRMELGDFAGIIKDNGKYLTGLGGSVTKGTQAFAKLSQGFFDNNFDSGLRQLGYTTKDMNELLAHQIGLQKSDYRDSEESQRQSFTAAANMAKEMDLIAKLTGKTREEQLEETRKNKIDGSVEAKFRLMSIGKTEDEVKKMRLEYDKGLRQAQMNGTVQSYKEFFASGTYLTKQAATEAALRGKEIRAQEAAIRASQAGDEKKAQEERDKNAAEALKNQTDRTLLSQATLSASGDEVATSMAKMVETNDALLHSVRAVAKENNLNLDSTEDFAKALKLAKDQAAALPATTKTGVVDAMIAVEKAQQDLKSGLARAATAIDSEGRGVAAALNKAGTAISEAAVKLAGGPKGNMAVNIGERAQAGLNAKVPERKPGETEAVYKTRIEQAAGGIVGTAARGAVKATETAVNVGKTALETGMESINAANIVGPMSSTQSGFKYTPIAPAIRSAAPIAPEIKATSQTIPAAVTTPPAKTSSAPQATGQAAAQTTQLETATVATASKQDSSLNDVVKGLDKLNIQMGQLISQQDSLMRRQERSLKSAGSNNVYDKA